MKRWAWLLVLPWVVSISSGVNKIGIPWEACSISRIGAHTYTQSISFGDVEACQDWAEALNEAHRRRLNPPTMKMFEMKTTPAKKQDN